MVDPNILKKLERILLKGSPILFTGAGFSKFAHNSENELIPDGCKLKDRIVKELLLIDDSESEYKELLVGGIKNRLKISVFYGEKVVHLADI